MPTTITARPHSSLLACDHANNVLQRLGATAPRAFAHSPYGLRTPTADTEPGMGFNGQYLERYGGYLLGNGYRAYVPRLRRFASPDALSPFGAGNLNAYVYCGGEPINQRDPSGHRTEDILPGAVTGLGVLVAFLGFRSAIRNRGLSRQALAMIVGGATAVGLGALALSSPEQGMRTGLAVTGLVVAAGGVIGGLYRKGVPMMSKKVKSTMSTNTVQTKTFGTSTSATVSRASPTPSNPTPQQQLTTFRQELGPSVIDPEIYDNPAMLELLDVGLPAQTPRVQAVMDLEEQLRTLRRSI